VALRTTERVVANLAWNARVAREVTGRKREINTRKAASTVSVTCRSGAVTQPETFLGDYLAEDRSGAERAPGSPRGMTGGARTLRRC